MRLCYQSKSVASRTDIARQQAIHGLSRTSSMSGNISASGSDPDNHCREPFTKMVTLLHVSMLYFLILSSRVSLGFLQYQIEADMSQCRHWHKSTLVQQTKSAQPNRIGFVSRDASAGSKKAGTGQPWLESYSTARYVHFHA